MKDNVIELENVKVKRTEFVLWTLLVMQSILWITIIAQYGNDLTLTPVGLMVVLGIMIAVSIFIWMANYYKFLKYLNSFTVLLTYTVFINLLSVLIIANIHP